MSLFEQWQNKLQNQNNDPKTQEFLNNYLEKETETYKKILETQTSTIEGRISELANQYDMDEITFIGFLDGINTSLESELDLQSLTNESEIKINIVFDKLYYNMLGAKAPWLYNLNEWDSILTKEERAAIRKQFNEDHRAVSNKVGRNEPCPCGSGKKYKKCCGA
jgi:hypothetical protein